MAELENHMVLGIGYFDEEAARRRLEREEYEMEHADDAWDDWLGGEPIEYEIELQVKEWGCGGGSAEPSGADAVHKNAE